MRVRGPNNVGKVVQTDPTLLRYASAITEQKKCWELLAEKFDRFQTLRNDTQQHPTTCNRVCKRTQHVTSNNVTCCRCYPTPDELEPPVTETDRPYPDIDELRITSDGVQKLLENLNPNKSMAPDQIHLRVLKQLSTAVSPILTVIFNKSLHSGEVPEDWRKANVAPIFKKGARHNAENYRPISLTCIASKIMKHSNKTHNKTPGM